MGQGEHKACCYHAGMIDERKRIADFIESYDWPLSIGLYLSSVPKKDLTAALAMEISRTIANGDFPKKDAAKL